MMPGRFDLLTALDMTGLIISTVVLSGSTISMISMIVEVVQAGPGAGLNAGLLTIEVGVGPLFFISAIACLYFSWAVSRH